MPTITIAVIKHRLVDIKDLDPEEFEIYRIASEMRDLELLFDQGRLISNELAKIIAQMFGSK